MIARRSLILSLLLSTTSAFVVPSQTSNAGLGNRAALCASCRNEDSNLASRRNFFQDVATGSIGLASILSIPQNAAASGGATAGGVYLLSAKQRYNERVVAGLKAFVALEPAVEGGSLNEAKAFFADEAVGGWKDSSAAGYLLSNAFRTSSGTPPDRLPSVQKWKAFAGKVDAMQKAIKNKSKNGAKAAYEEALALLDAYLDAVDLPPAIEL
mmetsp:Transcript_8224/g.9066  ORF Transcript_8224/g.9066 Transcript_8224/m.9066 type:complete len:212 (+) Transcript_8224:114-749(+)